MADSKNNKQDTDDLVLRRIDIAFAAVMLGLGLVLVLAVIVELFDGKSEDFRNWIMGFAAIVSTVFLCMGNWRVKQQADAGDGQAKTDRIRLTDERFLDAAKLLSKNDKNGKPAIAARIGGIFALEKLAKSSDSKYFEQVVKTLVAYIKENIQLTAKPPLAENKTPKKARFLGEDVKTAFGVLDTLLGTHKLETMEHFGLSNEDFDFCDHDFSWLDLSFVRGIDFCNYGSIDVDMRGAKLLYLDLRGAILSHAKLQKSILRKANLQGVKLEYAYLQGADLSGTNLLYADFSEAELDRKTILSSEWSGKIWHSGQAGFKERNIESRLWDAEWDLSPFLDSADSLVGVLHYYGGCHIFRSGTENQKLRAIKLRQAVRKLQKDGKIPEGFPESRLSWLGKVKEDGSHPGDTLPA